MTNSRPRGFKIRWASCKTVGFFLIRLATLMSDAMSCEFSGKSTPLIHAVGQRVFRTGKTPVPPWS